MINDSRSDFACKTPIRLCVAGLGRMGQIRLEKLSFINDVSIVGVIDGNPEIAAEFSKRYNCPCYDSLESLIKKTPEKVHGIWIASPTATHKDLIYTAANA